MGCDQILTSSTRLNICFNSRSPNGLRHPIHLPRQHPSQFQFTQPKWAATFSDNVYFIKIRFQFTQPKWAATIICVVYFKCIGFQFTQPKWAATQLLHLHINVNKFQFTQPKWAATKTVMLISLLSFGFNSRSPNGLRRLLQRYNKKDILSKDKSRKSLSVIILDEEDKAVELELTDNQALRNSNKIMFT